MKDTQTTRKKKSHRLKGSESVTLPVIHEAAAISKRPVVTGRVMVTKSIEELPQVVELELVHSEVSIDRLEVNRVIEGSAPQVREENGVTIVPVLEEEIVVTKVLVLKEEIHITRHPHKQSISKEVIVRKEKITLDRKKSK